MTPHTADFAHYGHLRTLGLAVGRLTRVQISKRDRAIFGCSILLSLYAHYKSKGRDAKAVRLVNLKLLQSVKLRIICVLKH